MGNGAIILISAAAAYILSFFSYSPYGEFPHSLAVISSILVFFVLLQIIINRSLKQLFLFPFLLLNWLYFQSPFLLKDKTEYFMRIIKEEYIGEIAVYTCISIFCIYFGYNLFFNNSVKPMAKKTFRFSLNRLQQLIYIFIGLGFLYRLGEEFSPGIVAQLSNIIQILFYGPTIVFALYTLFLVRSKQKIYLSSFHFIVIGFLLIELLLRLSTTLFANIGILFIGAFLVYYREQRKLPIVWIVIGSIILIPLYQSRKYIRFNLKENQTSQSRLEVGTKVLEEVVSKEDLDQQIEKFNRVRFNKEHNRFENLSFLSHVVLQHKLGVKDFQYGKTFYWLPLVPIPRIIFPSKPINKMSTTVATDYGLRGEISTASINFPMLVEGYINFGFDGMLIMALIFGMAYKWFIMKFGLGLGDLNLLIVINSIKQFTHAEGNITLVFGALIQVYLFWWILIKFLNISKYDTNEKK